MVGIADRPLHLREGVDQAELGHRFLLAGRRQEGLQCRADPVGPRAGPLARRSNRVEEVLLGAPEGVLQTVHPAFEQIVEGAPRHPGLSYDPRRRQLIAAVPMGDLGYRLDHALAAIAIQHLLSQPCSGAAVADVAGGFCRNGLPF